MSDHDHSITRKTFLKTSLLGLGAAAFPLNGWGCSAQAVSDEKYFQKWRAMEALPDEEKLNVALVGLGGYASGQLGPALQETKLCRLNGVVTGTPAKEDRWAEQYGIPQENIYNYDTFDRIAENDTIDLIYIVLPSGLHAEYSIKAAEAGKHVICEKPMATSVADAQAIVDACNAAGKKLSIGYRLHFQPHHEEAMRIGQQQVFGPMQSIAGGHSYDTTGADPNRWRLDKELAGGGPLMDLGIYPVQGAIYTMGELPLSVTAQSETNNKELFDEVEESITWELTFPGGVIAKGESSYSQGANYHRGEAENGSFSINSAHAYGGLSGETSEGPMDFPQLNQQTLQMDAFADHILNGAPNRVPGEMGVRDVKILYAIYEAAETGQRVEFYWGENVPLDIHV
jgi:predicted dehydrogenase